MKGALVELIGVLNDPEPAMTAPWLRRRSKTDELEGIVALCSIALHFVVAAVLAFMVLYGDDWLLRCYVLECGMPNVRFALGAFLVFDILLFLAAWGASFILSSNGWWRVVPALAGALITLVAAAIVLRWLYGATS